MAELLLRFQPKIPLSTPIARAVLRVSSDFADPIDIAVISSHNFFSFNLTASSTAISSKWIHCHFNIF